MTVVGADRAVPGAEEAAIVSVTSHTAVPPVRLILRVGAAPSTLPQGGSLTQQCTQAAGSSCVDHGDRRRGRGQSAAAHPARGHRRAPGRRVRRRELQRGIRVVRRRHLGAGCTRRDVRRDVLGARRPGPAHQRRARRAAAPRPARLSEGAGQRRADRLRRRHASRCGSTPARRVRPTRRSPGSVIRSNDQVVAQCAADGTCPPIAAPNGEQRTYVAFAVNGVGESRTSVRTVGWAYDPPPAPASVIGASGRHRRRRAASSRSRSTASSRARPAASRSRAPRARPSASRSARPDQPRGPVVPGRDEHRDADHHHAVLALRRAARARRQRVGERDDGHGRTASGRRGRSRST